MLKILQKICAKTVEKIFKKYPNLVLDGELLIGNKYQQKDLRGVLKKIYLNKSNFDKINTITYNIFDIIERDNLNETFSNRWKLSSKIKSKLINIVPTEIIQCQLTILTNNSSSLASNGYVGYEVIDNQNIKIYCVTGAPAVSILALGH